MRILRDHVLKEFFGPFFFCLSSFVFVLLLGRGFVQMADLVFNKDVDIFLILKLLIYSFPFILIFIIPIAVLLAALLSLGRLSLDNEIMAMRASGVSLTRIIRPLVMLTVALCLSSFLLSDRIASESHFAYRRLLAQIGMESPAAALEEGTFIKKFKNFVIFIYEIDKNKLKGIRIYQPQEGKPTRTIIAQKGELISIPERNTIKLKLIHGTSDEPDPKDPSKLYKLNFRTYDLPLNIEGMKQPETLGKKPKEMTVRELKREISSLGEAGIKGSYYLSAEIHHKYAMAFASLPFLLLGISLGVTSRRSEKSMRFVLALAFATLYWLLLIAGKALAQKGILPPFIALQISNVVIGSIGLILLIRLVKR